MRQSAGLLVYKQAPQGRLFFLVHPGGPFWKGKDAGAWSIPKGEFSEGENALAAARREFAEETGQAVDGDFLPLTPVTQKAGKKIFAWAVEGNVEAESIVSNTFKIQWPYKSGNWIAVPEVDEAGWFDDKEAKRKLNPAQVAFVDELNQKLAE